MIQYLKSTSPFENIETAMEKNRLFVLAPLIAGFGAVAFAQIFVYPGRPEVWHLFEILTVLAAFAFYIPGAALGAIASIAIGMKFIPGTSEMMLNYGRLALTAGIIGWYSSRQHFQQEHLGRLLMVDRLTDLHNYSYFIDRLDEERQRADRFGSRLSLIMLDIDHLKPFNDKFGHQKGNELLKHMAEIFKVQVRGVDIISRYGGEEFAILLPNTSHGAAKEVAERIRAGVETSDFATESGTDNCTISAGVATYPSDAEDDLQLIDRADEALYRAKEGGRNRVVVFAAENSKQEAIS